MTSRPLRLVLDTNTVMALWHFEDPALQRLHRFIETGGAALLTREDALEELRRVLAYRQFAIPAAHQAALLDGYAARLTVVAAAADAAPLPICRDADDQKFLEIARDGAATHLLSRDKALLRLARHRLVRPQFAILSPEAFQSGFAAHRPDHALRREP